MDHTEVFTIRTDHGVSFKLAISEDDYDGVTLSVRAGDFPLPVSIEMLLAGVPRGATVLDLGANIGTFALAAAAFGYDVVAVEASSHNVALLHESIRLNGFTNVRVVPAAVSDRVGTIFFRENGPFGIVNTSPTAPPGFTEVAMTTVDELVKSLGLVGKVGYVKIDIEGSETAAIHGMTELMARPDAPPIFYESNGFTLDLFGYTPATLLAEFPPRGYTSYRADSKQLMPLGEGYLQYNCVVDYLAVRGELAGAWKGYLVAESSQEWQTRSAIDESNHDIWTHRAHAARMLSLAKASVLAEPRIWATLVKLKADDVGGVPKAMEWFTAGAGGWPVPPRDFHGVTPVIPG